MASASFESMISNMPRGINSRPKKSNRNYIYIVPESIVSMDNDGVMRCGVMSGFQQTTDSMRWVGFTTAQIFKKGWLGMEHQLTSNASQEPIIGKPCYVGHWQGEVRVDITSDKTIITPRERIGVIMHEQGPMAFIKMDQAYTDTPHFQNDGFWAETS